MGSNQNLYFHKPLAFRKNVLKSSYRRPAVKSIGHTAFTVLKYKGYFICFCKGVYSF
jgi:hypothetical protein